MLSYAVELTIRNSTTKGVIMNEKLIHSIGRMASANLLIALAAMLAGASGVAAFQTAATVGTASFTISGVCTMALFILIARWEISEWRWARENSRSIRPH